MHVPMRVLYHGPLRLRVGLRVDHEQSSSTSHAPAPATVSQQDAQALAPTQASQGDDEHAYSIDDGRPPIIIDDGHAQIIDDDTFSRLLQDVSSSRTSDERLGTALHSASTLHRPFAVHHASGYMPRVFRCNHTISGIFCGCGGSVAAVLVIVDLVVACGMGCPCRKRATAASARVLPCAAALTGTPGLGVCLCPCLFPLGIVPCSSGPASLRRDHHVLRTIW